MIGRHSDLLDVGNDIVSREGHVRVEDIVSDVCCNGDSPDVFDGISSRIEQIEVEGPIDRVDDNVPCTLHGTVSSEIRQCGHMANARREMRGVYITMC